MTVNRREPLDLVDQMYTIAYWMTGSLKKANNLVYKTYQMVDSETSEVQLFKKFRTVLYAHLCLEVPSLVTHQDFQKYTLHMDSMNLSYAVGIKAILLKNILRIIFYICLMSR